ncbi:Clustered mitochondria [Amphibalanus amphitrite]|uniref:Clustered mitochondria n=1 Tax=Amphibalanus amphitrite TaxID=1232801 RepID=A0A6A4VC47_AMPAM|nr:Clustered mitochondria [Amphibalanus amphitrite]
MARITATKDEACNGTSRQEDAAGDILNEKGTTNPSNVLDPATMKADGQEKEQVNGAEMERDGAEKERDGVEKAELEDTKESEKQGGDTEKDTEKDGKKDDKDQEMYAPGLEPFDIQVSSMELVQEIHQLLMDREDTCHRTCFSLQLDGNTLDNFAELKTIEGLKDGSIIRVVEEPYTVREARIHVRHVRDLLKSMDPADAFNGVDCASLAFLNTVTNGDILAEKKKARPESVDCTPPDYIMPGCRERPLLPLQPHVKEQTGPAVLTTSGWNPPPGPRRMRGDLLYLYAVTMEDKRYHITASTRGFFVNQSTDEEFSPKPASPNYLCHSLIDLIGQISPVFKRNVSQLQKRRTARHPFERVATPYQVYTWAAPPLEHTLDAIRAEDAAFSSKLGYEEHIPGQTRDWNEEATDDARAAPQEPARTPAARAGHLQSAQLTSCRRPPAARWPVIDGNVMAINPGEDAKMQMFIWNNIFFSLGFDVRDHYKELGGDAAAFVAPRNDLQGVNVYSG